MWRMTAENAGGSERPGAMKPATASADQILVFLLVALLGSGLVLVFSASSVTSLQNHQDKFHVVKLQCTWVAIGLTAMLATLAVDYRKLRALSVPVLVTTLVFLVLVLIPGFGVTVNGATRWLHVWGRVRFQPAEIAKLAVILYLADALSRNYRRRESFRDYLLPNLVLLVGLSLLVVKQKSLSSAVLIMTIGFLMILVAHANLVHIVSMGVTGLFAIGALIWAEPYRLKRLLAWLNIWADTQGAGYQVIQSLLALSSGGVSGVGIGQGVQKIKYLPFVETDFIFAVLAEEMGLIGSLVLVSLFLGVLYRGMVIALRAPDLFGTFLAFGITVGLALQACLNMWVVTGLMPPTGVPLPFISFGGNSMVYALASFGLLLNVSRAMEKTTFSRLSRRWSHA
jgi:cell division protein FtsW